MGRVVYDVFMLLSIGIGLGTLLLFWLPFWLKLETFWGIEFGRKGMEVIVQNFDGLNFLVVAKSLYQPEVITQINNAFLTGNSPLYFSAHFPLFAVLIRVISEVTSLPNALLLVVLGSNVLLAYALWKFFQVFVSNKKMGVFLTTVAMFFPARMLSVRGVGSNEPLFIALVLLSLVMAYRKADKSAAILGSLAVLTRSPGILLFGAYGLSILFSQGSWQDKFKRILPYCLMPITLLGLFAYYGYAYGDYLAYFHSGDNLHLFFPPFSIFSNMQSWISDMWREDIVYLYLFYGLGTALVSAKYQTLRMFGWVYGATLLLVAHRDLARYALPLAPLAILGYERLLARVEDKYKYVALILIVPIYLFGWQFVLQNIQPINDWSVFIR